MLRRSRHSHTLHVLRHLFVRWPGDRGARDVAIGVLSDAQVRAPQVVAGLITEPHTGAWAASTTLRLENGDAAGESSAADPAYLSGLAAVAALYSGVEAELPSVAGPSGIFLPTVGTWQGMADPGEHVTLRVGSRTITAVVGGSTATMDDAPFVRIRRLTTSAQGCRLSVLIDDLNPFRDRYHVPATARLPDAVVRTWNDRLASAWALLVRHCPHRVQELADGIRSLVPLVDQGPGVANSATSPHAFGAIGLTLPPTAAEMAVTLVHEFQHSKLSALTNLVCLYDPDHSGLYFAPWRSDARPIGGMIHGIYSFLAVADTWHRLGSDPALSNVALRNLAEIREQVAVGIAALDASGAFTADGRRFAAGLRASLGHLRDIPLPPELTGAALEALSRTRDRWQRDNRRA
jgi:HEXXH motif-containing protein